MKEEYPLKRFENGARFDWKTPDATYRNCEYVWGRYADGSPALTIFSEGRRLCVCTACLPPSPGTKIEDGEIVLRTDVPGFDPAGLLASHGAIWPDLDSVRWIVWQSRSFPVHRLTPEAYEAWKGTRPLCVL